MKLRTLIALGILAAGAATAEASITSTSLRIQGAGLKVITETVTTSVDLPATVQTEFGGKQNDEAAAPEGVTAVGELTGPGIDTPIQLSTAPGHRFQIPGLAQQGIFYLQNVRLVKGTEFLQYATPATAVITVADLLQTKVSVRQLSPDELRARGIVVDARNYDVFEYSFTFIIDGQEVKIPFPVIIDPRTHEVQPVVKENPYQLPPPGLIQPPRWSPPQIIPMDFADEGDDLPEPGQDELERAPRTGHSSIPAAIVIPNSLAALHQFFAVAVMVTNGAPEGSTARLEDIKATIKIPTALRTVKTTPEVSFGQAVPIVEPTTGVTFLIAQSRGEAEWTLEGLQPGTHRIDFDLRATLRQPGQIDVPMRATPSAAIVVHDPRFNINFSHPDTVRKGVEYSTYSFITNMSATDQTIIVSSGVQTCAENPNGNVCRLNGESTDQLTIPAGDMRLIEYRLKSGVTGHVFATAGTLSSTDNLSASVSLHMGVSETGIPLSPATLIMPYYAQFVNPEIVNSNLLLLGLGYSLATAPLNQMTAKFPRVIRTDVFQRAVDISRAGQRIFITDSNPEQKRDAIAHLALDLLGNGGYELREWDDLRRQEKSGRSGGAAVMAELAATGLASPATMTSFFDAFASATAHRQGFVAALAHGAAPSPTGNERPYAVSLVGHASGRRSDVPNEAASGWKRDLPFSDISRFNGAGESGELALVGRWTEETDVVVTPAADGAFQLDIVYPDTNDGALKRAHFDLTGTKDQPITVNLTRGASSLNARFANGGIVGVAAPSTVSPAPLRIAGARQDLHLDADGHKVSVLFNRPVKVQNGVDLRTKFAGAIDFNKDSVVYKAPRPISAAALQDDGRTVDTTFDHTLSQNATYTIEVQPLLDAQSGQTVSFPDKIVPKIDNDTPAGIVYGKVIKGDNSPIAGADVKIAQYLPNDGSADPRGTPQYDVSQTDGSFLFEFIRRQIDADWLGTYRLEGFSTVNGKATVEGVVRLPGKVHFVNLQYLGRGAAQGYVKYNDGSVVAGAVVTIGSTMFSQFRTAVADAQGHYRIEDLPVGPLTFSAKDTPGNVTFAANEIATPGQLVTQDLSIFRQPFPGVGKVFGVVRRSDTNAVMAGIHVGVYSQGYGLTDGYTDSNGHFEFDKIPAGFVTVLAEDWVVARQSVAADIDLKANEIKEANLFFLIQPDAVLTTLTGEVWREDALHPGVQERVAGALVKITGYRTVTADSEGKFTYENIPAALTGKQITAYDPATQRVNSTIVPDLTQPSPHVAIFIGAFSRGTGTVRVRLLNAAGKPVAGYRVIVPGFPPDVLTPGAQPGIYELKDAPVGQSFDIWAVATGTRPAPGTVDPRPYGDQMTNGRASVQFNGHIAALTLRLPGEGTVRVKVRSQFDLITPVTLTYPVWYEGEQDTVPETVEETTDKNGQADWAVFTKIPALSNYSVASAHPQYGSAGAVGQLVYDGDFRDHVLQLNTLARVRGTVYAIDGITPIAGASVTINNGRSDPGPQITGPDGRFEFFDQPSSTYVTVTAQVTQSGIYRIGFSTALTPANGGVVENMAVVLRKRGFVDGQVVYKDYKRYDANNPANNIADNTPNDYSDNAPVPLAKFYLRELDFPNRTFGRSIEPLVADVTGHFVINNIFVGSLRATGWDPGNEELRGDWTGRIDEEGAEAAPKAYIAVTTTGGGVGSAKVTVVDPNQSYAAVQNAEVNVYAGGRAFDFASTDATGSVQFDELPAGTYTVSAYSKSLGKTSKSETVVVPRDGLGTARLELEFSGVVDGTLTDPENANAPVPGSVVRLTASNYQTQASTDVSGAFIFNGVREGSFRLDAKDTLTNRRASADRTLSVLDPHRTVTLELEPTATFYFAAYLPDDLGGKSDVLAAPVRMEVVQRCYSDASGGRHCDYERQLQGNPLQFPGLMKNAGYAIGIWEPGQDRPTINLGGAFPQGSTAANPFVYVYPAYGEVRINVTQGGAPANGAKVNISGGVGGLTVFTDSLGQAVVRNIRLGNVYVQASSIDGKFTGATSVSLQRQSVPAIATIALGSYAGVSGFVEAETGGPSAGTRVVANYASSTAEIRTDSNGRYTFLGIPTPASGTTGVNLVFIGPDDTTVGAGTSVGVKAGDTIVEAPAVKLDATAPQLETIAPADGALNVSPDTNVTVTFSEPLSAASINATNFQLLDADNGAVACALTSATLPSGKFTVTMTPPRPATGFPLRSNTLHRVIVSGAVTDRTGHPISATRGFTFTTSDYAEPRVQKALPLSPIPAATTFEFRFNEPIDPAPWKSGGNGVFHIYKLAAPGGAGAAVERELAARAFPDPATNMSLFIAPEDSNPILPESFYRVVFFGVKDPQGNALAEQTYHFYSFDNVAPHVVFTAPLATEQLVSGSEYELHIELRNGSPTGSFATDIQKVEYFTVVNNVEHPFATVTAAPFYAKVLGPEAPASGASFTVGAQAYDASGNQGPKTLVTWTVKPNAAPTNVVVTPSVASAYPSTTFTSLVTFQDEGSFASVNMTFSVPRSNGTTQTTNVTQSYTRLANGNWPEVKFTHVLPSDAKAGDHATLSVTVSDVRGLVSAPVTATVDVAADTIQPNIVSVTPPVNTTLFNKDKFTLQAIVSDAETGVQSVTFLVDGDAYATASQAAGPIAGTQKFTSVQIEVKSKADDAYVPIVVTAKDFNGNTRQKTYDILYKGANDPDAPKVTWLCPSDRGALPALAANFALKLRVNVVDQDVRSVKFLIGNDGTTVTGALVSGTEYGATYTFTQTPAAGPLTITAVVEDTVAAHTVELPLTLDLVSYDFLYTDPKAITAAEAASFSGKTVVLVGSGAVLAPQSPLTLKNLLVLGGARVETLATTITREFKLDITTTGITYVDCDSRIDETAKGYAGGWQNTSDGQNLDARGRTVGNTNTGAALSGYGASYAGIGGTGFEAISNSNAPYGSMTQPTDLGSGGSGSASCCTNGQAGGGAIALHGGTGDADASRIVIGGQLLAEGGDGSGNNWAPGTGGSIWLDAKQVLFAPKANISANGGDDEYNAPGSGGSGGGRIAIAARTKLDVSTAAIQAHGGYHRGTSDSDRTVGDSGAGTIVIRKPGQESGELTVSSYDARHATSLHFTMPTPLGRIKSGTSTAVSANALTDASRTFDKWMIGEELVVGTSTARSFTVTGISVDGKSLQTDPADGSLLEVATSQTVAYSGKLTFDKITAGPRSLLVFDEHASSAGVVNDKSAMAIDPTAAVVLVSEQAATATITTTPAAGANIIRDTPLALTYTATDASGVGSVTFNWSPESTPRVETFNDYPATTPSHNLTFTVPATTPLGTATLATTIKDRAGRTYTLASRTYTIVDNTAPVVTGFSVTPGNSIYAGRDVTATVTATDDISVKTITFDAKLNGTSIKTQSFTPNSASATAVFTVTIAPDIAGGSTLTIDTTISDGFAGRAPTAATQTIAILTDSGKPTINVTSPVPAASYKESSLIPVRVAATDAEVAVKEATVQFDGGTAVPLTLVAGDWRADILAPPVDGDQPVQRSITVTAKDYAGNTKTTDPIALTITPVIDANAPLLSWTCSSSGAMFPAGTSVKLRVTAIAANAQNPVQSVQMYIDDSTTPLAAPSVGSNQYEATLAIPAGDAEGRVYRVRAIAASAGGATSDLLTTFTVIVANSPVISASTTIDTTTTTWDGKTVVITGGTVTIRGPHTFDRLIVLGGSLTHAGLEKIELTTTRGTYVACGGSIDTNGRGYGINTSYPGAGRSTDFNGGSHIGRGGNHSGEWGLTYGSIYRPQEHGGGAGSCCGVSATVGGGVVRLTAGSLTVDGTIGASSADVNGTTGAGGSIWITTGKITGAGTIAANSGVNTNCCNFGSGGGGAVALEYTDATSVLPTLQAFAGTGSRNGGGGTVYVKGPGSTYGNVTVDNQSNNGQITELPSLGNGAAQTGTAGVTLVTGRSAIPAYFAGHWVEITSAAGTVKGTWRIATVTPNTATVTLAPNGSETIALEVGDKWQGVYLFDTLRVTGGKLVSADPVRAAAMDVQGTNVELQSATTAQSVLVRGTLSATSITATDVTIDTTGLLRQFGGALTLNTHTLTVRGAIDVSGQGFGVNVGYPGAARSTDFNGGAHIGRGGFHSGEWGTTYGSVYRPQEAGGGAGACCGVSATTGGGVVRIIANSVVVDGGIRANSADVNGTTGAGGSIWITTGRITGTGSITANSGVNTNCCNFGSGGGGAVAVEYTDPTSVLPTLQAFAGTGSRNGGGGAVYVKGAGATYGDLTVDNRNINGQITELPSLGNGTAQAGTSGVTLATGRSAAILSYFAGHWVEITSAGGTVKGTWRIATILANGTTVTLAPNGSETIALEVGDKWQGVYLFDTLHVTGAKLVSADPIRAAAMDVTGSNVEVQNATTAQSVTVRGTLSASNITGKDFTVETGGVLQQFGGSLSLNVQNLVVRGAIDVSGQGYGVNVTYPGAARSTDFNGGAHIGRGGFHSGEWGTTYGSVYRPQEGGGGAGACCGVSATVGGGVVRIIANTVVVDGTIRANSADVNGTTGAGGSIWITTGKITGTGSITTNSGVNTNCCNFGSGGGGALALEYTDPTSVLPTLQSFAGTGNRNGGGGAVYVKGPAATYGDLTVDNRSINGQITELPSLGNGTAQPGTAGVTLATGRSAVIPAYFAGHWVEITSAAGTVKGTWRIATILPNGTTVTLAPNGSETIALEIGDKWQGVYLFDTLHVTGAKLVSADPIRAAAMDVTGTNNEVQNAVKAQSATIRGSVLATGITATDLTVDTAGVLSQYGGSLTLNTTNLTVRGAIDVTGQGFAVNTTYPGAARSTDFNGGAHIGRGGFHSGEWGTTYGSVYRPQEGGGGAGACCGVSATVGGGVVRITANTMVVDGAIRANSADVNGTTGAGGSIWITTGKITGAGSITANSGRNTNCCNFGSGGGGALALEYTDPASVVPTLQAMSQAGNRQGGPGIVYVKSPTSTYGDAIIDNAGRNGQPTDLPSLGRGRAQTGTSGATIVTELPSIPTYFVGHWVDVFAPGGARKGTWRIASISGKNFTLAPNGSETIDVLADDTYRGVYLFDKLTLRNATVRLLDDIRSARDLDANSSLNINDPPTVNAALVSVQSNGVGDFVAGVAGAVTDLNTPIILTTTNKRTGATFTANAAADGSFSIAVSGEPGDRFTLFATDSNALPASSAALDVSGALANVNGIASITFLTAPAKSGTTVEATVRMLYPITRASAATVTLSSSSTSAVVPATITIPVGASAAAFRITTTSVTADKTVTITAANNGSSMSSSLRLLQSEIVLTAVGLAPSTVQGGTSINATALLNGLAPVGGATVSLSSSDTRLAAVPDSVFIPAGATSADFTVTTYAVAANTTVRINGTYGDSTFAIATLTACSSLGTVAKPAAPALDATWIDDNVPGGVASTGDGAFDTTQSATGVSSIHLSGAAGTHTFAFAGATAFAVTPSDKLVLYALVNPCNPPREILAGFKAGATEYRAGWGESRIEATTAHTLVDSMPMGGRWVRLEVPAKAIGITGNVSITDLSLRTVDGEVWIDSIGKKACVLTQAPPPEPGPNEQVWFDDDLPGGATAGTASGTTSAWTWDTTQIASGIRSHLEPLRSGYHDHYFNGAASGSSFSAGRADVLFAYVYLDPCNPPREVMLHWTSDGTNWQRAYWGEDLNGSPNRVRMGPLPAAGGWVRLDVPALTAGLAGRAIVGMAFGVYDGQAWFDRAGKVSRVNVALGKTAKQSSDYAPQYPASRAVNGDISSTDPSFSVTQGGANEWWEVDLGASYPIDTIDVHGRTDCCPDQTSSFFVFVSDAPFAASDWPTIKAQPGVSGYAVPGSANTLVSVVARRSGRYVRIQRTNNGNLTLPEVEVWAAATAMRTNLAGGRDASRISIYDSWGEAVNAINGITNQGYTVGGSIFHTRNGGDTDPWWEVDMGAVAPISTIDVWGRIDCCPDQTASYYVLVSDVPFTSKVFATSIAQAGVSVYFNNAIKTVASFPINRTGRYVRMQRSGPSQFISLDELQVWGQQPALKPMSKPLGPVITTTTSSPGSPP